MEYSLTIDRFENEKAVLKTEDGATMIWPKNKLPANLKEGAVIIFTIFSEPELEKNKKKLAKDILNEILDVEEN